MVMAMTVTRYLSILITSVIAMQVNIAMAGTSETSHASAIIMTPVSVVTSNRGLRFGEISAHQDRAGNVRVSPEQNAPQCVNLTCFDSERGPATFDVSGSANAVVSLTISERVTLLGLDERNASNTMTSELTVSDTVVTFDERGKASFSVGGALSVLPGQAAGRYSGAFVVNLDYQ